MKLIMLLTPLLAVSAARLPPPSVEGIPRYNHVVVIVEENKDYAQVMDAEHAPSIARLAAAYGNATRFFGEVHPSEANYVALLSGDTFGIHDDDAYYCRAGSAQPFCDHAREAGYADHTVAARHLGDQLVSAGLTWKGYYGSLPEPGSGVVTATDPAYPLAPVTSAFYASKHSGFMNFADVQSDPHRAARIVGIHRFDADLEANRLPAFSLVVPNQCDEMHGLHGNGVPVDCDGTSASALIRRGDTYAGRLVARIQASPAWKSRGNMAVVITFDEGSKGGREGCCGAVAKPGSELGGGHIPTIVITNHGGRGIRDETPYNHYSLLRTIEDAFGITEHLRHAGAVSEGVQPMEKLFSVPH